MLFNYVINLLFFKNFTNKEEILGIYKDFGVHPEIFGKLSGIKFWINLVTILLRYGFTVSSRYTYQTLQTQEIYDIYYACAEYITFYYGKSR